MRKKFLAVAAATVMSMSMAMTAFAAAPDDYTGYYTFDENLDNATGKTTSEISGAKVVEKAADGATAKYTEGVDGKALQLDGTYGVKLGQLITKNTYTVSFDLNPHSATFGTSILFIESMKGSATPELWEGIATVNTNEEGLTAGAPRFWSNSSTSGGRYILPTTVHSEEVKEDNWFKVTFVKDEKFGTIYINGEVVAKGYVQDTKAADSTANYTLPADVVNKDTLVWLGVNYWDAAFIGDIDNLYTYDRALTEDEIKGLVGVDSITDTVTATLTEPEFVEKPTERRPQLNDPNQFVEKVEDTEDTAKNDNMTIIIVAVAAVVVVVVIVAVVLSSKKKGNKSDKAE